MTKIPALTEEQVAPFARALITLEDVVEERERERSRPYALRGDPPTYEELTEKLDSARSALFDALGELMCDVASEVLAWQARRFSAADETEAAAP